MKRLAHAHHRKVEGSNEIVWHIQLALLVIIALQTLLEKQLTFGFRYYLGGLEVLLLIFLMVLAYTGKGLYVKRTLALLLVALITVVNVVSLVLVVLSLFGVGDAVSGNQLILSAASIYFTNILIFGLWYWEMDFKGGVNPQDFLFAQMNAPEHTGLHKRGWDPTFFDYLYISITNATAFSPTDTMPLTHRAKLLMSVQSLISIVIVVLVTARAVNAIG